MPQIRGNTYNRVKGFKTINKRFGGDGFGIW